MIRGRFSTRESGTVRRGLRKPSKNEMNQSIECSQAEPGITVLRPFSVAACRTRARQAREFAGSARIAVHA